MKFLLDHDVPEDVANLLRHWGHNVTILRDILPVTTPDPQIFAYICDHRMVMVTCNRNHSLAIARAVTDHPGLIIHIRRRTRHTECAKLHALLARAGETGLKNNINFA